MSALPDDLRAQAELAAAGGAALSASLLRAAADEIERLSGARVEAAAMDREHAQRILAAARDYHTADALLNSWNPRAVEMATLRELCALTYADLIRAIEWKAGR